MWKHVWTGAAPRLRPLAAARVRSIRVPLTLLATTAHPRYTPEGQCGRIIVADPSHASRRMCRPCSADTPFPALVSPGPGALPHSRAPCSLDPHTREDNHAMELNGAHITRLSPPVSTIQCVADSKTPVWLAEGVSQEGTDSRPHCASETSLMTAIDPGRGAHAGAVFVPHTSSHPYCG